VTVVWRVALVAAAAYGVVLLALWALQSRLAFPAPRAPVPDPAAVGLTHGARLQLALPDGTPLAGWFLAPRDAAGPAHPTPTRAPALLWFYGNGENIGTIWPVLRDFQPPGMALLVVDYPGYGGSGGRASEAALHAAAEAAWGALAARPEVDSGRIVVYGRSLGTVPATRIAATHPAAGLILESPFTSAREMARQHYGLFPRAVLRLTLDNLGTIPKVTAPLLVIHGTADRLVSPEMGRRVAAAARGGGPVELVWIEGAGHNDTYAVGGRRYRDKVWEFITKCVAGER
jgi:hypothetical protein